MKLIVYELTATAVVQELTPSRNVIVEAVRPHLYRHLSPTGSLYMEIRKASDDSLVATSETINIVDISPGNNYSHGYIRFYIDAYLTANTAYKFKLLGSGGYTFSESAYIGWCNGFDLGKYAASYSPANDRYEPLDIEIWERK